MVMHREAGTREHFRGFLAREFPELAERYGHLYAAKYAPPSYVKRVQEMVGVLKARYGLPVVNRRRGSADAAAPR
jgi:hypothetical protein